jgi:RNA polymerase sigma-70 factor (ECF subfamily)
LDRDKAKGMAYTTSESLLLRLRNKPGDQAAWARFVDRYGPLIARWCRKQGLGEADVEDVSQDVLARLVSALKKFSYDPSGRFRGWLRTVVTNALRDHGARWRGPARGSGDSRVAEVLAIHEAREDLIERLGKSFDLDILQRAMESVSARVAPHNWQAFVHTVLEGRSVADTARALGIDEGMVYVARCKIPKMLKREVERLVTRPAVPIEESSTDAARRLSASGGFEALPRAFVRPGFSTERSDRRPPGRVLGVPEDPG